jgi:hypothetical protein
MASSLFRLAGQALCLATLLLIVPAAFGAAWAPLTLIGTGAGAAACLLSSALLRNIARWKQQAAVGREPESISILALAAAMALGVETDALVIAELEKDRAHAVRRKRPQRGRNP